MLGADRRVPVRDAPLEAGRWYRVTVVVERGAVTGSVTTAPSRSPGRDVLEPDAPSPVAIETSWDGTLGRILLGRSPAGDHFDGHVGGVGLDTDGTVRRWDLSVDMDTRRIAEVTGDGPDGELHQLPTHAVTGSRWDGTVQAWTVDPSHYDAVHFHSDDLYDAGWEATASLTCRRTCRAASTRSGYVRSTARTACRSS